MNRENYNQEHLWQSDSKEFKLLETYDRTIDGLKATIEALRIEKEMIFQRMNRNQEESDTPLLNQLQPLYDMRVSL